MSRHELTADDVSAPSTHASTLEALQPTYGLPRSTRKTTLSLVDAKKERTLMLSGIVSMTIMEVSVNLTFRVGDKEWPKSD